MDIALDTNIVRNDFLFRSNEFLVLFDYLEKTQSKIVLPQIVLEEIEELYKRQLKERIVTFNNSTSNINLMLSDESERISLKKIDVQEQSRKYIEYLFSFLKLSKNQILPYKNEYLTETIGRAIKKLKPFRGEDKGFRDAIIWLTLKDYCKKCHEKQVIFISKNIGDFTDGESLKILSSQLQKECEEELIKINFYESIPKFIAEHSTKIDFINESWLYEQLNLSDLTIAAQAYFDSVRGNPDFLDLFERESGYEVANSYNLRYVDDFNIKKFSVYEMLNGEFVVSIDFTCVIAASFEYLIRDHEYGYSGGGEREDTFQHFGNISINVNGKEVSEIEINDLLCL